MADSEKLFLGIDIGSTTYKAVIMSYAGKVLHWTYQRTQPVDSGRLACTGRCSGCGNCSMGAVKKTTDEFMRQAGFTFAAMAAVVVTGSQIVEDTKRFIPFDFQVSEVSAHVAGAKHFYPEVDAIIDCGGQDSKCMVYNHEMGLWTSMMSGVCAAGTGSYLDSVAAKLGVPVEEISEKVNYDSDTEFSSVCAVLSATSINKFKNRIPLGDLLAGAYDPEQRRAAASEPSGAQDPLPGRRCVQRGRCALPARADRQRDHNPRVPPGDGGARGGLPCARVR